MEEPDEILKIITIGRQFPSRFGKPGIWAAELLWVDDDGMPTFHQMKDEVPDADNVAMEVRAVVSALRFAADIDRPIEIHAGNESVVKTIDEYAPRWKSNNWRRKAGPIASLAEWQEIDGICQTRDVSWIKRERGDIDVVVDYERLWELLADRENQYAMNRAIARDPY